MDEAKANLPLKIGLLIVAASYFLFTFHEMFTLSWIGEWNYLTGTFQYTIFVEDISASIGLVFRFIASLMALITVVAFFVGKGFSRAKTFKVLRLILVFEAVYWLGLLATGILSAQGVLLMVSSNRSAASILTSFAIGAVPSLVESIAIPAALFVLAFKLSPDKPAKDAAKWALIAGTIYIVVFWLVNSSMWYAALTQKGVGYLASPETLVSFILTTIGLLALAIYTGYFTKKTVATQTLNIRVAGAIITLLGLYFLWNYLTWILFGGWSNWYAWFLGHNMDLWMLSLPLAGVPLLFTDKPASKLLTP